MTLWECGPYPIVTFEASDVDDLKRKFHTSIDDYLSWCAEDGVEPRRGFSGKLNLRLGPDLHRQVSVEAAARDLSINEWITRTISKEIEATSEFVQVRGCDVPGWRRSENRSSTVLTRVHAQLGWAKISVNGHSLEDLGQVQGSERRPVGVRTSADLAVRTFQESSLPVVWAVQEDSLAQDDPVVAIHVPSGDLRSVLVGIGQECREPQLLILTRVRVIADKHVDRLAPERPADGPFLVKDGERPARIGGQCLLVQTADLDPELVGEAVLPGSGVAEDRV